MHSALKTLSLLSLLGLLVVACESKTDAAPDAGVVVVETAPSAVVPVAVSAAPSAAAPTAAGGAMVRPAGVALDAGLTVAVDAGATGQECCCEAASFPLQSVAMSDCAKVRKGQCVAKTKCTADAGSVAPAASKAAAGGEQTCCCATGDKKAVTGMSACTKGGQGKCVKATECR